jgi:type II secretory pathway component PulM
MSTQVSSSNIVETFAPMSARRLLIFGGIALIAAGMLFGDIFAVFVLHQNGGQTGQALLAACQAASTGNALAVKAIFQQIGGLLEDHGTKVDAHVHMTDAGYLALLLALVQSYVALPPRRRKLLAGLFLIGGLLLPVGIFLIHYVGLAYSPFRVIGWASVLADAAGALLIVVLIGEVYGLWKFHSRGGSGSEPELPSDRTWERRTLMGGGAALILLGFLYGAWYAGVDLYRHEAREAQILRNMLDAVAGGQGGTVVDVASYGSLAAERAIKIAAHSHVIEFGLLAMLLSFVQPYIFLSDLWKRRWVILLLAGSVILPAFVLLELHLGLLAGGIADLGGLLVIIALVGMLVGVLRYSGRLDAASGSVG